MLSQNAEKELNLNGIFFLMFRLLSLHNYPNLGFMVNIIMSGFSNVWLAVWGSFADIGGNIENL